MWRVFKKLFYIANIFPFDIIHITNFLVFTRILFNTRSTVAIDTLAKRAISLIPIFFFSSWSLINVSLLDFNNH